MPYIRMAVVLVILCAGFYFVWHTQIDPGHVNLYVATVICGVTIFYALVTFEILGQNQAMAKAATDSTQLTERALRFSYSPSLIFQTISTKDPNFANYENLEIVKDEDYRNALTEYGEGGGQKEFVFAFVQNMGRGSATNLDVQTEYSIVNSSSPNKNYSVNRSAQIQILKPEHSIALCICIYKVPTAGDKATLVSASLTASDFYRDAVKEPPQQILIAAAQHQHAVETNSVVQIV